ncbi:unnamed protein product [Closterium sp. NIES-53]
MALIPSLIVLKALSWREGGVAAAAAVAADSVAAAGSPWEKERRKGSHLLPAATDRPLGEGEGHLGEVYVVHAGGAGEGQKQDRGFSAAQWNRSSGAAEQVFSGAAEQVQRRSGTGFQRRRGTGSTAQRNRFSGAAEQVQRRSGTGSAAQQNRFSGAAERVQRRSRTGPAAQQNRSAAQQRSGTGAAAKQNTGHWRSSISCKSTNFGEWCYGVEKHLLSLELKGICLKDILLNRGKGKMPLPPDPLGEGATATANLAFDAKTTKYETDFSLWEQADAAMIRVFITTTPIELVKSYRTFRSAHDIWKYLQDRFHDKTAVGVAILIPRMFQIRLEECPGMADYISEIRNIHEELKDIGITFPEQAPAAGLLVGLTPAYNVTSSMLKQLPTKELTFEKVASALLSAEKDLAAQASVNAVRYSPGIPFRSQQGQRRNSFPPCQYLIRKGPRAGQKCNGTNHPEATCFKKRDDEWYDVHGVSKDKRPPNWAPPRRVNQVKAVEEPAQAFASAPSDVRLNLLFSGAGLLNEKGSQYIGVSTTQPRR